MTALLIVLASLLVLLAAVLNFYPRAEKWWRPERLSPPRAGDDVFKRRLVSKNVYQCGCRWERWRRYGDVLVECPLHKQAGEVRLKRRGGEKR